MNIPAKETTFLGTKFRSALEANWAATLSSLDIAWEYEPRLIRLPSGCNYLPDFWLPQIGTWLEVKGDEIPRVEKAYELAEQVICKCTGECTCQWFGGEIVLVGRSPLRTDYPRRSVLYWQDARYPSAHLAQCGHCRGYSWIRMRVSFRCRLCKVLDPRSLTIFASGTGEFESRYDWHIDPLDEGGLM